MTPELYDLSAQITALPGWGWRPGMRYLFAAGKLAGKGLHLQNPGCTGVSGAPPDGCVPDLADDATAGAMMRLLLGAGMPLSVGSGGIRGRWWAEIGNKHGYGFADGATQGEAHARLVVARGGWR